MYYDILEYITQIVSMHCIALPTYLLITCRVCRVHLYCAVHIIQKTFDLSDHHQPTFFSHALAPSPHSSPYLELRKKKKKKS